MTEEVWKDIAGYEGIYKVSNLGNIKSFRKNKETVLKPYTTSQGYKQARLFKDGKSKGFFVHRLVAQAFLPNPESLPCINHKNEVKDDNRLENLEWCSYKYNSNYGTSKQRISSANRKENHMIGCYDPFTHQMELLFVHLYEGSQYFSKREGISRESAFNRLKYAANQYEETGESEVFGYIVKYLEI